MKNRSRISLPGLLALGAVTLLVSACATAPRAGEDSRPASFGTPGRVKVAPLAVQGEATRPAALTGEPAPRPLALPHREPEPASPGRQESGSRATAAPAAASTRPAFEELD